MTFPSPDASFGWCKFESPEAPPGVERSRGPAGVDVGEDLQGAFGGSFVESDPGFYAFVDGFVVRGVGQYLRGEGSLLVEMSSRRAGARQRGSPAVAG